MPQDSKPRTRLDPRRPLVLDTSELGRRAGSLRRLTLRVPAPEGLRLELIGVPAKAAVDLDLRLESVMEGVLVTGTATAPLDGECGRCLDPVDDELLVELQELYGYPESDVQEDEASRLEGDLLDLEPVLRDAVLLALPLTPLCHPDCGGLCVGCGERLDELGPGHAHETTDLRWAALERLAVRTDAVPTDAGQTDAGQIVPAPAAPGRVRSSGHAGATQTQES